MGPIEHPRQDYRVGTLDPEDVAGAPLHAARRWLDEAIAAGLEEPTAVTLATVDADGVPDARVVLLRGFDDDGLVWFTNRSSAKGQQLASTPSAAVVAYWPQLERQIRFRGPVQLLDDAASDAYFDSRPRGSQLGAWASKQSQPVADRAVLEAQVEAAAARFDDTAVPRPPHWGGYRMLPSMVELWQGRASRLHDRVRCTRGDGGWTVERLQP